MKLNFMIPESKITSFLITSDEKVLMTDSYGLIHRYNMDTKTNEISNFLVHEYLSDIQKFDDKRAVVISDETGALIIGFDDCKKHKKKF